jgi:uncharacterized protein YjbI with pentapeptide repeats
MKNNIINLNSDVISGVYKNIFGITVNNQRSYGQTFSGSKYENLILENVILDTCELQSVTFKNCKFVNCKFVNCNLEFVKFQGCNFIACSVEGCNLKITNSHDSNFLASTFINVEYELGTFDKNEFIDCKMDSQSKGHMESAKNVFSSSFPEVPPAIPVAMAA